MAKPLLNPSCTIAVAICLRKALDKLYALNI
jgi:hypothetical protein